MNVRPAVAIAVALLSIPIGWSVHARWQAQAEIDALRLQNAQLELENASYEATASGLVGSLDTLEDAIAELSSRLELAAVEDHAVDRLPRTLRIATLGQDLPPAPPDETFSLLGLLLQTLSQRLQIVRQGVALRESLAAATPNIWPSDGWLSGTYGYRRDPFTGERDFHPAIDISTRRGQPVYATATGRVVAAHRSGNYGHLIEIAHGFGLRTRYGHLSEYAVAAGDTVQRGDVIGYAGATGRATGYHVHYEVWVDGETINPLRLLPEKDTLSAN